jgi:hypothetical protein
VHQLGADWGVLSPFLLAQGAQQEQQGRTGGVHQLGAGWGVLSPFLLAQGAQQEQLSALQSCQFRGPGCYWASLAFRVGCYAVLSMPGSALHGGGAAGATATAFLEMHRWAIGAWFIIHFRIGEAENPGPELPPVTFQPAERFRGARRGFVFQLGGQGLGYYEDTPVMAWRVRRRAAVALSLADLLEASPPPPSAPRWLQPAAAGRRGGGRRRSAPGAAPASHGVDDVAGAWPLEAEYDRACRRPGVWTVVTANLTAWSSAGPFFQSVQADAVLFQEHQIVKAESCAAVEGARSYRRWRLSLDPAVRTPLGGFDRWRRRGGGQAFRACAWVGSAGHPRVSVQDCLSSLERAGQRRGRPGLRVPSLR